MHAQEYSLFQTCTQIDELFYSTELLSNTHTDTHKAATSTGVGGAVDKGHTKEV